MTYEKQNQECDPGQGQEPEGTLLRGPDGALYFIPDDKLEPFQIPEEKALLAEKLLYHESDFHLLSTLRGRIVQEDALGLRAGGSTTVSVVNLSAVRRWRP